MSTTFTIIPTKVDSNLTFKNVLELAKHTLEHQLTNLSINLKIELSVNIHGKGEAYVNDINLDSRLIWTEDEYAWFTVDRSYGGTDAYCREIEKTLAHDDAYVEETLGEVLVTPQLKKQILDCKYEWWFRRSAGQSPLINLTYGHLAAAVAKLTEGYIYSDDGAWHDIFPATADQLIEVYFYPDKAKNPADYDWATTCVEGLRAEYASK